MEEKEYRTGIDYKEVWHRICVRKKLFFKIVPTVMILSCLYILCIPRTYTCDIKLAPEYDLASVGNLNSLAAQFGLDIGNAPSTDAISPTLYPDLIESTDFVTDLFSIHVKTIDEKIDTDYYTYLKKYQKYPWWTPIFVSIKNWVGNWFDNSISKKNNNKVDPFMLTKEQHKIVKTIKKLIKCSVDKKTDVISFTITDQDPLICATMADSVSKKLQDFITNYRTSKARNDVKYYKQLTAQAKQEYIKARQLSGDYGDTHTDVTLKSYLLKQEDLENDQQLKYNTYSAMQAQLQSAMNKVQERTPAFTILQSATVPIRPTGPKRIIFIAVFTFLAFAGTALYVLRDILKQ